MQNRVAIYPFDQDPLATVSGTTFAYQIVTGQRFNGSVYNSSNINGDAWKYSRFFSKGGQYKVRIITPKQTNMGILNLGLDSNATKILSSYDLYAGSNTNDNVKEVLVEISRGYHDITFLVNGKNASSSAYFIILEALEFDLVQEYTVYQDDQAPRMMPTKAFQRPSLQFATLAADYGTSSTSALSTGTGVTVSSPHTNKILVNMASIVSNSLLNDGVTIYIYRSTSSIPTQGSAVGGSDTIVYQSAYTALIAGLINNPNAIFVDSSLTPGVTYYYYIAVKAVTAGTATVKGGNNQTTITAEPV